MFTPATRRTRDGILYMILGAASIAPLTSPAAPAYSPEYSIPSANHGGILDWEADGSRGIWIKAAAGQWYYASFSSPCSALPFSSDIGFIPQINGELNRWSSIRLAQNERCFFRKLKPSEGPVRTGKTVTAGGTAKDSQQSAHRATAQSSLTAPITPTSIPAAVQPRIDRSSAAALPLPAWNDEREASLADDGAADALPLTVVVQGRAAATEPAAPTPPCGLAAVAWLIAHPAEGWRIVAPLPPGADADACYEAANPYD